MMKTHFIRLTKHLFVVTILTTILFIGQNEARLPALAQKIETTAIINVNVIPMDTDRVLNDHVVIVEDGLIAAVGPTTDLVVPDGAVIINGQGGYLMPGLVDMHMHFQNSESYKDPGQLLFFLSQGTTTVRSLGTSPDLYHWKGQIDRGEIAGPTTFMMGRTLMGNHNNFTGMGGLMKMMSLLRLLSPLLLGGIVYLLFKRIRSRRNAIVGGGILFLVGLALLFLKTPPFMVAAPSGSNSYIVENIRQIKLELDRQQELNVDGAKLYDGLKEEEFLSAVMEARMRDLYVTGHLLDQCF